MARVQSPTRPYNGLFVIVYVLYVLYHRKVFYMLLYVHPVYGIPLYFEHPTQNQEFGAPL